MRVFPFNSPVVQAAGVSPRAARCTSRPSPPAARPLPRQEVLLYTPLTSRVVLLLPTRLVYLCQLYATVTSHKCPRRQSYGPLTSHKAPHQTQSSSTPITRPLSRVTRPPHQSHGPFHQSHGLPHPLFSSPQYHPPSSLRYARQSTRHPEYRAVEHCVRVVPNANNTAGKKKDDLYTGGEPLNKSPRILLDDSFLLYYPFSICGD